MSAKLDVEGPGAAADRRSARLAAGVSRATSEAHAGRVLRDTTRRLDLVSREEFDAQARVLERSRELIGQLEARVAALEGKPRQ